jgi:hypothetical protein
MLAGVYPPRQAGQKTVTASSKYMFYQETLARFDHPFLLPSFESVVREKAVAIWLKSFRTWPRMR